MSHIDSDNPKIAPPAGRTPAGQFAPGNPGGPGNPYARKVAFLRQSLNECISASQVKVVVNAMFKLALAGNVPAARLFLQYAVGKPQEPCNPDRIELDEFQLRQECAEAAPNFETQTKCPPLAVSNVLVSINDYMKTEMYQNEMINAFDPKHSAPPQTAESAPAPEAHDVDLPKAHEAVVSPCPAENDRPQTAQTAPSHRQQTAGSVETRRQQTAQTAPTHRQQTTESVETRRQQTAQTAAPTKEDDPIGGVRVQTA